MTTQMNRVGAIDDKYLERSLEKRQYEAARDAISKGATDAELYSVAPRGEITVCPPSFRRALWSCKRHGL